MQQRHVGFAITEEEPGSLPYLFCEIVAEELGAVHQLALQGSVLHEEEDGSGVDLSDQECAWLTAGVIWNDFPLYDEAGPVRQYEDTMLEQIAPGTASYLTRAGFRRQAKKRMRLTLAAVYKKVPNFLCQLFVDAQTVQTVTESLRLRTQTERTYYHFMLTRRDEPDSVVVERAAATARRWYFRALTASERGDALFLFGHLVHMVQDSYSAAHTNRVEPDGKLAKVYYFEDQGDRWHSSHENLKAVMGAEKRRLQWCVVAVYYLLRRFLADLGTVAEARSAQIRTDASQRMADAFVREMLLEYVFVHV